jgi:SAM-dependent methyltransferase
MSVFNLYARYYDLLYRDKDYRAEVEYVVSLIRKYKPESKSVLDLGCGTGRHDFLLVEKGYSVTGVDQSEEMLAVASARLSTLNSQPSALQFIHGDIQSVQLKKTYDVILALFHVVSYQTTNNILVNTFTNVYEHLNDGGVFIFDFWYGPAVLTDRPTVREKRLEDKELTIHRIATPVMHPNDNTVDVNYEVVIKDRTAGKTEMLNEIHRMRYLFLPELEFMLNNLGFDIVAALEWMSLEKQMGFESWNGVLVTKK